MKSISILLVIALLTSSCSIAPHTGNNSFQNQEKPVSDAKTPYANYETLEQISQDNENVHYKVARMFALQEITNISDREYL